MKVTVDLSDCLPHAARVISRTRVRGRPPKRADGPHASMFDDESRWRGLDGTRTTRA